MEVGINSFGAMLPDPVSGIVPATAERLAGMLEEIETADRAGLDMLGVGEHYRPDYADAAPAITPIGSHVAPALRASD